MIADGYAPHRRLPRTTAHDGRTRGASVQMAKAHQVGKHFRAEGCCGLDLDREGAALELADQVYFEAAIVGRLESLDVDISSVANSSIDWLLPVTTNCPGLFSRSANA